MRRMEFLKYLSIYLLIYLAVPGLSHEGSSLWHVGSLVVACGI